MLDICCQFIVWSEMANKITTLQLQARNEQIEQQLQELDVVLNDEARSFEAK